MQRLFPILFLLLLLHPCIYQSLHTKLPCQACQRDFITVKVWCYCFSFPYAYCCSFSRHFLVLVINDNTVPPFREWEVAVCSLFFLRAALLILFVEGSVLQATIPPWETWWDNVGFDIYFWSKCLSQKLWPWPQQCQKLGEAALLIELVWDRQWEWWISDSPHSDICSSISDIMALISSLVISLSSREHQTKRVQFPSVFPGYNHRICTQGVPKP